MSTKTLNPETLNEDPFMWLEEVDGKRALEGVEEKNRKSMEILTGQPHYREMYSKGIEILNSSDRIAAPSITGKYIYNFWQDSVHIRGIWRRTPREDYFKGDTEWEILIDIDKMSEEDGTDWVFKGATGLHPDYSKFMVSLSRGGGDAVEIREFDANSCKFVQGGFYLPESKGGVNWIDNNTLLVASDFGEGSMTDSGYPNQVRLWKRGTCPGDSPVIFTGEPTDVGTFGGVSNKPERQYVFVQRAITFYTTHFYVIEGSNLIKLDIPEDAVLIDILKGQVIIDLKSDWKVDGKLYKQGSLVSAAYEELTEGTHRINLVIEPGERSSVTSVSSTNTRLIVNLLTNVTSELFSYAFNNGQWTGNRMEAPEMGTISVGSADNFSDNFFFYYQNFLTPSSLYYCNAVEGSIKIVRSLPDFFDADKFKVRQYEARSADGTMIPYFIVGPKEIEFNGKNPTLLYAYGGFEVPMLPSYSAVTGKLWLERGGIYVLANIRGGGEFGPGWHQAGLKENRQRVFDDFHAVAEDLHTRNITSGKHLGIQGGSNGGLLVGVAFTQRPELYNAVVCQVPLLDMKRYNNLLAGASWMGEYGNPDIPEEWDYIKEYSPYHNLRENNYYPEVFFTTSTRDDRVHPGHARKMVALMEEMGYNVYYFENTEGGHAGASTNEQRARSSALGFAYLLMKLGN